jgi:hypothetical protein
MVMCDLAQALWIAVFANWVSVWTTPACSAAALLLCERRWRFPGDSQSVHKKIERIRKKQTWTWTHTHTFLWIEGQGTLVQQPLDHRINDRRSYGPFDGQKTKMISGSLHGQRQFKHSSQSPSTTRSQLCCNSFRDSGKDQDWRYAQRRSKTNERVLGICGFFWHSSEGWKLQESNVTVAACVETQPWTPCIRFCGLTKGWKSTAPWTDGCGDYNETCPTFHSRLPRKKSMTSWHPMIHSCHITVLHG